jgi:4'-phosphopantetheinyl transferase
MLQFMLKLSASEVHIWYVFSERSTSPETLRSYEDLLSMDEKKRRDSFAFVTGKYEYLVARALLRTTLSRYAEIDPRSWIFAQNAYGRPEVAEPAVLPRLMFNISHCQGLVACAVVVDREIGIDVEDIGRNQQPLDIAVSCFSESEVNDLRSLPPSLRDRRFFEYWTLKESYIKARGLGFALPLKEFSFDLDPAHPVRISFSPRISDDPKSWQFELTALSPRFQMALAVRKAQGPDLSIITREAPALI